MNTINPSNYSNMPSKTPAFGHAKLDGKLWYCFKTPELAKPFIEDFKQLNNIKLNLKELTDFEQLPEASKKVMKDFFDAIGEKEAEDYTVGVHISPEYTTNGQFWYKTIYNFRTYLKGIIPIGEGEKGDSQKMALKPNKIFALINNGSEQKLKKANYEFKEYKTGIGTNISGEGGISVWLPTAESLKNMVKDGILNCINNISISKPAQAVENKSLTQKEKIKQFNKLQKSISE